MDYGSVKMFCQELSQDLNVSVVNKGTNPNGKVLNVLGLLNRSLNLNTLVFDFPSQQMAMNGTLRRSGPSVPIIESTYLSVNVNFNYDGVQINQVIIDTGTKYVLSDHSFPEGLNLTLGNVTIPISSDLIGKAGHPLGSSIIVGYMVLQKYRWEFDFQSNQMWVYS